MKSRQQWWVRSAFLLPLVAASVAFILCNFIILSRILYPYELEWIEGGSLQVVVRILDGLPVYSIPTPDYVAPLYMPFFFYVSAVSAKLFGVGLPALRLVSYLAALMTAFLVSRSVWEITRSRMAAVLSILCWGAVFKFSGSWYDVARVDSLWTFFLVGTVTFMVSYRYTSNARNLLFSAIFYSIAVFTKQSSLLLAPFFLVSIIAWSNFAMATRFVLFFLILGLIFYFIFKINSGDLFYFFTMKMAGSHNFTSGIPKHFLLGDIFFSVPVILFLSIYFLAVNFPIKRDFIAWASLFAGFFSVSLLGRWYSGGYFNVLMPFHQLWIIMGVSGFFIFVMRSVESLRILDRLFILPLVVFILSLNIAAASPNYLDEIPTAADRVCGDMIVRRLSKVEGKLCVPRHGYLGYLAGKNFCAHEAFAVDLVHGSDPELAISLVAAMRDRLLGGYYNVLLVDTQAQFFAYNISFDQLRYTATDVDCPADVFYPIVSGQRPLHWLEYNGEQMKDLRAVP